MKPYLAGCVTLHMCRIIWCAMKHRVCALQMLFSFFPEWKECLCFQKNLLVKNIANLCCDSYFHCQEQFSATFATPNFSPVRALFFKKGEDNRESLTFAYIGGREGRVEEQMSELKCNEIACTHKNIVRGNNKGEWRATQHTPPQIACNLTLFQDSQMCIKPHMLL